MAAAAAAHRASSQETGRAALATPTTLLVAQLATVARLPNDHDEGQIRGFGKFGARPICGAACGCKAVSDTKAVAGLQHYMSIKTASCSSLVQVHNRFLFQSNEFTGEAKTIPVGPREEEEEEIHYVHTASKGL